MITKNIIFLIVIFFVIFSVPIFAQTEQVYSLSLNYLKGEISVKDISVVQSVFIEPKTIKDDYRLEIISFAGEILYEQTFGFALEILFEPPREWFDDKGRQIYFPSENETRQQLEESSLDIILPYFPDAKSINIYNNDYALLMRIDVTRFSITCGNNICEPSESYFDCRQDCSSGREDNYCDGVADNICDPDCSIERDVDCELIESDEKGSKPNILALIIALIVLVAIIVFGYFEFRKMKDKKSLGENYRDKNSLRLKTYINKELNKGVSKKCIRDVLIENGWKEKKIEDAFKGAK